MKNGNSRKQIILVGNWFYTNITEGINTKIDTVCVLTGKTTLEEIGNGYIKPICVL